MEGILSLPYEVIARILNNLDCASAAHLLMTNSYLKRNSYEGLTLHSGYIGYCDGVAHLPLVAYTHINSLCRYNSISSVCLSTRSARACILLLDNAITSRTGLRALTLHVYNEVENPSLFTPFSRFLCDSQACKSLTNLDIIFSNGFLPTGSLYEICRNCSCLRSIPHFDSFCDEDIKYFLDEVSCWPVLSSLHLGNLMKRLQRFSVEDALQDESQWIPAVAACLTSKKFPSVSNLVLHVSYYELLLDLFVEIWSNYVSGYLDEQDDNSFTAFGDQIKQLYLDTDRIETLLNWEKSHQWSEFYHRVLSSPASNRFCGFYSNLLEIHCNNGLPSSHFLQMLTMNRSEIYLKKRFELDVTICIGEEDPSTCVFLSNYRWGHRLPYTAFRLLETAIYASHSPILPFMKKGGQCIESFVAINDAFDCISLQSACSWNKLPEYSSPSSEVIQDTYMAFRKAIFDGRFLNLQRLRVGLSFVEYLMEDLCEVGSAEVDEFAQDFTNQLENTREIIIDVIQMTTSIPSLEALIIFFDLISKQSICNEKINLEIRVTSFQLKSRLYQLLSELERVDIASLIKVN